MSFVFFCVLLTFVECARAAGNNAAAEITYSILVRGIAPALIGGDMSELWNRVSRFIFVYAHARHNAAAALNCALKV